MTKYLERLVGGPNDGAENDLLDEYFPMHSGSVILNDLTSPNPPPGPINPMQMTWGLYEFDRNEQAQTNFGEDVVIRIYRYVRSLPYAELEALLNAEHDERHQE
jgi:hypothetical protein